MADEKDVNFGGLAAALNSRLNAESRITNSVGFFWLCGGAAICIVLAGMGVAAALYGYSSLLSAKLPLTKSRLLSRKLLEVTQSQIVVWQNELKYVNDINKGYAESGSPTDRHQTIERSPPRF